MNTGRDGYIVADKHSNLSVTLLGVRLLRHHTGSSPYLHISEYSHQASHRVEALLTRISILTRWLSITEDCRFLNPIIAKVIAFDIPIPSADCITILGMLILPVPT